MQSVSAPEHVPETNSDHTSRRTIVRGAAWAAPVIVTAAAAPSLAASNCPPRSEIMDPRQAPWSGTQNVAIMQFVRHADGSGFVYVEYVKAYASATAINVNGVIVKKWDNEVQVGDSYTYAFPAGGCFNPSIIQVDGNNTHWYSHVNGGQGGWQ